MKSLFKHLRISKKFEFPGHFDDLEKEIEFLTQKHKGFGCKELANNEYKIIANWSLGTLIVSGGGGSPIAVRMKILDKGQSNPIVAVRSKVRIEHYLFIVIFFVVFVGTLMSEDEPWYMSLLVVGIFIIVHFWFHWIYRLQENELINKLKRQLKIVEV